MADSEASIRIDIDTSSALASIKNLQRQISAFHTQMQASGNAANAALSKNMQKSLVDSINSTGKFSANLTTIKSTTESFTNALEKNKLGMGEYFRYAGASTKTFGRLFKSEFSTIDKVARERVKTLQTQYIKMGRDASGALQAIKVRPIALDMQNLGTQTAMAAQKQALFNQLIKQGSTNLLNWGKNTQWAGRQLMVGFTIPLAIMGSVAVKEFKKIEEQSVKFRRVYGDMLNTDAETERALKNVKSLAQEFTKYGIAIEKTIDLAAKIAQMGNTGKALDQQVIQATRLSVLGGMEQMDALDTTISLTNAFGVSIEKLSSKINFLNAAENQTILAIEDFNTAIPLAGSVVKQLGGEVEDLAVLLTAMREGGINASQAGNALKSSLARLIAPSRNAKETLSEFGIDIMGIVENNAGNLMNTINAVAYALDELAPLSRARAIEALFGKFQFARMSTLFSNITREGSQANKVLELTKSSAEELAILAERELKRVEDSPAFKLDKQIEKLKAAMAPIGEEFVKLITPIVEFATKLLEQFNNMSDGGKQFVTGLVAVLGLIAPAALMVIGLVANGVANLLKGFNALRLLYQRFGASSTELASQTQFLTTEQLEAAAVAASLEQSHARLTQSFTSETTAIYKLVTAYQAATRAQLAMNAAAAGRRVVTAPPITRVPGLRRAQAPGGTIAGYNKGTFSVPGPKGAGDIIPAMLSPGEAVIPAKQAQKYSGIVSSLISDNVPGFRFGLNPFASMLGRSNVAVRMGSSNFISALQSGGKNARYKSAFETQTGADYINRSGSKTTRQRELRSAMERDVFGLDPKTASLSSRPTYGYAKTSILQSLINSVFGIKGKNFNALTRGPGSSLHKYGDIDLITKRSVAKRSSAFPGDGLVNYNYAVQASTRRYPNLNNPISNTGISPAPMRGASPEQLKNFERLGSPFGANRNPGENSYWTNPKSPYVETYTPGGFSFKEIDRVIANNPVIAKQLRSELKAAGLGSVKVSSPNFVQTLLKRLGVPGYNQGTAAASLSGSTGSLGRPLDLSFVEKEVIRSNNLNDQELSEYLKNKAYASRGSATLPSSISKLKALGLEKEAVQLAIKMAKNKVAIKTQMSILGDAVAEAKKDVSLGAQSNKDNFRIYVNSANTQLDNKNLKGDTLKRAIRQNSNYKLALIPKEEFAHIGSGAKKIPASKVLEAANNGQIALTSSKLGKLKTLAANNQTIDIKSGLGFTLLNDQNSRRRVNSLLGGSGATAKEFKEAFNRNGPEKWAAAVAFGGGNPNDPSTSREMKILNDEFKKIIDNEKAQFVVDTEDQVKKLANKKPPVTAVSVEKMYMAAMANTAARGGALRLSGLFDNALQTATEFRDEKQKYFKPSPNRRILNSLPLSFLSSAGEKLLTARFPALRLAGSRRAFAPQGPVDKYARGVVSVPGPKGAGDVVPAMLSPGEAVIPAQMSKKYAPLINSMISDSIPGYAKGKKTFNFGDKYTGYQGMPLQTTATTPAIAGKEMAESFTSRMRAAGTRLGDVAGTSMLRVQNFAAAKIDNLRSRKTSSRRAPFIGPMPEPKPKQPGAMSGKLGAVGGVAGMGAMMYGMSGGPGANAAMMAAMPLMMLPMLLDTIKNKAVLVTIGFAALAAGIYFGLAAIKSHFDGIRTAAMNLADSFSIGEKAIDKFAQFAGKATASEIMSKRRLNSESLIRIATGKSTFGSNYMESESGQELLNNAKTALSKLGKNQVISQMTSQLVSSIFSGALSADQARSIAANLGQELGDLNIGMAINAQLVSLIGNGTDILKDPLPIAIKIMELAEKDLEGAFERLENVKNKYGDSPMDFFTGTEDQLKNQDALIENSINNARSGMNDFEKGLATFFDFTDVGSWQMFGGKSLWQLLGGEQLEDINVIDMLFGSVKAADKVGTEVAEASGAYLARVSGNMYGLQQALDSVEVSYQKQIDAAEKAGDTEKKELLIDKRRKDRIAIMERYSNAINSVRQNFNSMTAENQDETMSMLNSRILEKLEGDAKIIMEDSLKRLDELVKTGGITKQQAYLFKVQVDSGNFDQTTIDNLLAMDSSGQRKAMSLMLTMDSRNVKDVMRISSIFLNPDGTVDKVKQTKFIASFQKLDPNGVEESLKVWNSINATTGFLSPEGASDVATYYQNSSESVKGLLEDLKDLNDPKLSGWLADNKNAEKEVTISYIEKHVGENVAAQVSSNYDYFKSLDPVNQILYMQVIATIAMPVMSGNMDQDVLNWALENNKSAPNSGMPEYVRKSVIDSLRKQYLAAQAELVTLANTALPKTPPSGKTAGGGGAGKTSWIDDVLKKLKNLTDASINAKGGIKELKRVIDGTRLNIFDGLGQKFSKAGISEAFSDELMDMGKRARKKFVTIGKDGTAILTKAGQRRQKAYDRITLGQFSLEQNRLLQGTREQTTAVNKLAAAGMSLEDAYAAVEDKALAAAIAGNQLSKVALTKLVSDAKAAATALKEFQTVSSVRLAAEDANNLVKAAKALDKSKFSFAEKQAILSDSSLTELFLSGKNQKLLQARIKQILTPEFLQGIFDEGFNAAMNAFAIKEKKIELDFEAKMKADFNIVEAAQNEIAGIEYVIDDLQAGLKEIEDQEEKINESYNKRIKALDDIKDLNSDIANQQKGQISVAEALSRGDISSAAKAIQELRASESRARIDSQRKALELSREKDLSRLTSLGGKTRKQLEEEIKKLQNDIFRIEEDRLEPAQRRIDLATIEKNELIESITVLDKTRTAWENIENGIDLARIESKRYTKSITDAIAEVENLKSAWKDAVPGGTEVDIPAADPISSGGASALPARYIPGDTSFNRMVDLYRAMDDANRAKFRTMVGVGPGENYSVWKANRLSKKISDGNLNRAIAYMSNGKISNAEISEELARPFSFAKASGGYISGPGTATSDSIPAMLSDGEYVIRASSVDKFGKKFLDSINSGVLPNFNMGGKVPKYMPMGGLVPYMNMGGKVPKYMPMGGLVPYMNMGGKVPKYMPMGGLVPYMNMGGGVKLPKREPPPAQAMNLGGLFKSKGTDTVPAMLTPGEFVMRKYAVQSFGADKMKAINSGTYSGESVYNYSVNVNVQTDANADQIARSVMTQIKQIDSQRIRSNRF